MASSLPSDSPLRLLAVKLCQNQWQMTLQTQNYLTFQLQTLYSQPENGGLLLLLPPLCLPHAVQVAQPQTPNTMPCRSRKVTSPASLSASMVSASDHLSSLRLFSSLILRMTKTSSGKATAPPCSPLSLSLSPTPPLTPPARLTLPRY